MTETKQYNGTELMQWAKRVFLWVSNAPQHQNTLLGHKVDFAKESNKRNIILTCRAARSEKYKTFQKGGSATEPNMMNILISAEMKYYELCKCAGNQN
jgi:hypothetical protein